jgi:hypothetical protein
MKLIKYMSVGMISHLIRKEDREVRIAVELMTTNNSTLETQILFKIKTRLEDMELYFCKTKT